jgi:glutamate N-acetyltransferase/amino-acid N-acetyltransferase
MMEFLADGTVTTAKGFMAGAVAAGVKQSGNLDVAVVASERECVGTAVFTTNQVAAAPVLVDKATLANNQARLRAVVANAGNANACTGEQGMANARAMQQMAAAALGCDPDQVLVLSTGVIGVQLPMDKVEAGILGAVGEIKSGGAAGRRGGGERAARAIMTTDTRPKQLAVLVELPGGTVTVGGMAKGSGMIHPNMATMLAVVTTDAAVLAAVLDGALWTAVNRSFNCISVDGDTSTNDTVILLANGASGVAVDEAGLAAFQGAVTAVCIELAKMIVRDGEGASKFVEIQVSGTATEAEAHQIANTIATSPLVKTAFAGGDPNWGRILAAAGRAGVPFDQNECALWVGDGLQLLRNGAPADFREAAAAAVFGQSDIRLHLSVGTGRGEATVWTCDLTHEYVSINADYRT